MREHDGAISAEFLDDLAWGDPAAWADFLGRVYASARRAVDTALTVSDQPVVKEVRRLVRAYHHDQADVHVALDLARTSFQTHVLSKDKPLERLEKFLSEIDWPGTIGRVPSKVRTNSL